MISMFSLKFAVQKAFNKKNGRTEWLDLGNADNGEQERRDLLEEHELVSLVWDYLMIILHTTGCR